MWKLGELREPTRSARINAKLLARYYYLRLYGNETLLADTHAERKAQGYKPKNNNNLRRG